MSSEIPPTDYFTGISFNPDFYQSSSSDYLTASTAKSYFLAYPTAQGTETITTLKTSSIDSATPTTAMNLLSSQTANLTMATSVSGTIRLGAYTTTSTHIGNIDHQNNNINNASAPSLGSLGLGTSQTDGILNLGTGSRTATGVINIGTGALTGTANAINLGSNSSAVKVNGTLTIGTNAPTATASITSAGAISGTTITGSGLITGLSFQNTNATSTISSAGAIGGSSLSIANNGYIQIGGLAAIINGINVVSNIATTGGNITASAGTITGSIMNSTDYSSTSASTNMEVGKSTTSGALYIGHNQTGGALNIGCGTGAIRSTNADINIGTNGSALSIGNINIGYAGSVAIAPPTSVQLNGLVKLTGSLVSGVSSGTTGILAGRSGYLSGGTATLDQTVMNSRYIYIVNTASSTITLPASPTTYQIITIKSIVNTTTTIAGYGRNMWITGVTFAGSYTLPVYGLVTLFYGGTDWYQI